MKIILTILKHGLDLIPFFTNGLQKKIDTKLEKLNRK